MWGNDKIGLQKILEKHLHDFTDFAGNSAESKIINAPTEIIDDGKLVTENGVNTIIYKNNDETYRVGLSKGFHGNGENNWVITAYRVDKEPPRPDSLPSSAITKGDGTNLHPNGKADSTTKTFNMADTNIDKLEDFLYYAKLAGFEDNEALRKLHKKMRLKKIQKEILC